MPKVKQFSVVADLGTILQPLKEISTNLWWTWHPEAVVLMKDLQRRLGHQGRLNPKALLNSLDLNQVSALERDEGFIALLMRVHESFKSYHATRNWWPESYASAQQVMAPLQGKETSANPAIAYFSLEFGIHESLPLYSGGLGVLAGDHLKASSDLGLPLLGVGLLYYEGYFSQYLNADGWQQESYPQTQLDKLPLEPARGPNGEPAIITVEFDSTEIFVRGWILNVGSVHLLLLDTNIEENEVSRRSITQRLYGGDAHTRIQQEIVLGIGGHRMLQRIGYAPSVYHMNEGHSAFLVLERTRACMQEQRLSFDEALYAARSTNLFTTHTPVPAGNDVFSREIIEHYFSRLPNALNINMSQLLGLGRFNPQDEHEPFSMTILALKGSRSANGVSELHGKVSRKLWHGLWPKLPIEETPISFVTNGIHTASWLSQELGSVFSSHLGTHSPSGPDAWNQVYHLPDEQIWHAKNSSRDKLVQFSRTRASEQLKRRGAGRAELEQAQEMLDPNALTIGFARRFAAYKRAYLLLQDIERLIKLASSIQTPVQFIFAGKAHPADNIGKEFIAQIIHAQHRPELRSRFLFIEDYDMDIARRMVQGVDVWLNNPRRPLEACGTSGMKVAINGGLNFSVLDGWWCEAHDGGNGWAIGQGEEYYDTILQDQVESRSVYDLLEREIVPLFYARDDRGVPQDWIRMVKHSLASIGHEFSAARMVAEYASRFYIPLLSEHEKNISSRYEPVRSVTQAVSRFQSRWNELQIIDVFSEGQEAISIGQPLQVRIRVRLGSIQPKEIAVQVLLGSLDATSHLQQSEVIEIVEFAPTADTGIFEFSGLLSTEKPGAFGYSVRLVPRIQGDPQPFCPGLLTWWE